MCSTKIYDTLSHFFNLSSIISRENKNIVNYMDNFLKYIIIGIIFWILVDFTTAFNPDIHDWISHMPLIWFFYTLYPLFFAFIIYKKSWNIKRIFISMLVAAFIIEVLLSNNTLLYTFPIMLIMIPVAICIYGFITFTPKWIIEGEIIENKKIFILFTIVWIIVSILNFKTKIS